MEFKCEDNGILVVCYLKCDEELYIELFECGTITGDIKEEKDVGELNCLINDGAQKQLLQFIRKHLLVLFILISEKTKTKDQKLIKT